MLIPVLQVLRAKGDYELIVLGLTTASEKLQEAGLPHIGYRHLVEEGDYISVGNLTKQVVPLDLSMRITGRPAGK